MSDTEQQQSRLKELIAKGKEQGFLTFAEVNDHLPEDISDPEQVEEIIQMINDLGIQVFEEAPDADTLLLTEGESPDEIAAAEAAAALAAVETEAGRTTDPVRMYMREMGTVELLTREGEIVIAKRIEEGIRELMASLAYFPGTVKTILDEYEKVHTEGKRLGDVLVGYLDPMEPIAPPTEEIVIDEPAAASDDEEEAEGASDEEESTESGPDPEIARARFGELLDQYAKVEKSIKKHGRYSKQTAKELHQLGEVFKFFKLTPRMFDPLVVMVRSTLNDLRARERDILQICVRDCGMDRKVFIRDFQGNETNLEWIDKHIAARKAHSSKLNQRKEDILNAQRAIQQIEKDTDLSITDIK